MGKVIGTVAGAALGSVVPGVGTALGAGIGGGIGGAVDDMGANKKALSAQMGAANQAIDVQKQMFDQTREDVKPFRETGYAANTQLSKLMGLGGFDRDGYINGIKSKFAGVAPSQQVAASAPAQGGTIGDNSRMQSLGLAGSRELSSGNKFSAYYNSPDSEIPPYQPASETMYSGYYTKAIPITAEEYKGGKYGQEVGYDARTGKAYRYELVPTKDVPLSMRLGGY